MYEFRTVPLNILSFRLLQHLSEILYESAQLHDASQGHIVLEGWNGHLESLNPKALRKQFLARYDGAGLSRKIQETLEWYRGSFGPTLQAVVLKVRERYYLLGRIYLIILRRISNSLRLLCHCYQPIL